MGNAWVYLQHYDIVRFYKRQDWLALSASHSYQLCRHKFTHQTAQVYQLPDAPSIEDMNIYDFRNKQQHLLKVYFVGFEHHTGMCGNSHTVEVLIEHIPYKFQQLIHLTQQEALTAFVSALRGFKLMEEQFGAVEPSQQLMGINIEGKLKVWLNANPVLNVVDKQSKHSFSDKFSSASIRVRKLYSLVQQKCRGMFLPYCIKEKFCNRQITYNDAIVLVQQYARNNKLSLSKYLLSDIIMQRLLGKADSYATSIVNKDISFAGSLASHPRQQLQQKTLKKTVSLINMARPRSILNNSDSTHLLNYSKVASNLSTQQSKSKQFTQIRFVHSNTPTKIFYSPKNNGFCPSLHTGQDGSLQLYGNIQQADYWQTRSVKVDGRNNTTQKRQQWLKRQQQLRRQEQGVQQREVVIQGDEFNEQSDIVIVCTQDQVQKQQEHMAWQQSEQQQSKHKDRHKQLFTTFGKQGQSELCYLRSQKLAKQQPQPLSYHKQASDHQSIPQAIISPSFNSAETLDKALLRQAEIHQPTQNMPQQNTAQISPSQPEIQFNQSQSQSLQSIDSRDLEKKRKRTSIFAAVEIDYAISMGQQMRADEVRQVQEQTTKQMVFGSFSKIGSFNIVRTDSLLQKKYQQAIVKQNKQNKPNADNSRITKRAVDQQAKQEDFLDVDYLEKSLDKRYSPHLSKRALEKQPSAQDDALNIEKLEEGLMKFSKHPNHHQVHQINEYSITVKQPQELHIERINFQPANPSTRQASNSIRVAESDSHRVDNWEISDTSINMAIISNKQKQREESLKRTSSSSRFHFYDKYGRKNSSYEHQYRQFDSSFSNKQHYRQPNYYRTWQLNSNNYDNSMAEYNVFHINTAGNTRHYRNAQFEEKYRRHVQLRNQHSRPITSYHSSYIQNYLPKGYADTSQQKQQGQIEFRAKKQVRNQGQRNVGQVGGKVTYQQLRELLWN